MTLKPSPVPSQVMFIILKPKFCGRGEDIFISLWNLHRSPLLWENPEAFIPERWPLDGPDPTEVNQSYRYGVSSMSSVIVHAAMFLVEQYLCHHGYFT